MHRRSRLIRNRLGHERRIHIMVQRRFANRPLEQKHLIRQRERVAMQQIDFHLRRALFMDQRINLKPLAFREVINIVKQIIEFVHGRHGIGLPPRLRPARPAHRRLERIIRILIALNEVELHFGRHNGTPAALLVKLDNPSQHLPRRDFDRATILMEGIMDHLRRRVRCPRHDRQGRIVRHQVNIAIGRVKRDAFIIIRIFAGDRLEKDRAGQRHFWRRNKLAHRHHLAASHTRHIGNDALDIFETTLLQPGTSLLGATDAPPFTPLQLLSFFHDRIQTDAGKYKIYAL